MSICQRGWRRRGAFKIDALGSFLSSAYALELTVPHKTVAEVI
jgi:hypothetical protein